MTNLDKQFMSLALSLAAQGAGWVNPNPMVGCVIVDDAGNILGRGWHKKFGGPHAEREALKDCLQNGNSPKGAIVYVTLEPCCHWGKTPSCTEALIEAQVARVVVGARDDDPRVKDQGCAALEAAGIEVQTGVLEDECRELNKVFFHFIKNHTPYIIAKYAMTLDGRTATLNGESKWITGKIAREHVHLSRSKYAAIMVGIGTVLNDDPLLNCRLEGNMHQPSRIVCDSHLRTPLDSQLVKTANKIPLILAIEEGIDPEQTKPYLDAGCVIVRIPSGKNGSLDLVCLVETLGKMDIDSIYVEGGSKLLGALFDAKLPNYLQVYIAPKIFGGEQSACAVGGIGVPTPQNATKLLASKMTTLGDDLLFEGTLEYN